MTVKRRYQIYKDSEYSYSAECREEREVELKACRFRTRQIGEAYKNLSGAKAACKRWGNEVGKLEWKFESFVSDEGADFWYAEGTPVDE